MNHVSHAVWFVRWLGRLASATLRRREVVDLVPSVLVPRSRLLFDRRLGGVRTIALRRTLADYWSYDQCIATTGLDLDRFPQGRRLRQRYEEMVASGKRPIILDCGANIGCSAYWFSIEYPHAQVLAIEPDVENVQLAIRNTRHCGNVRILRAAVASTDCNLRLVNEGRGSDAFRTEVASDGDVPGYSIATLLQQVGAEPDQLLLAKIDIEGFESELFSRHTEWVDHAGAIIVETHDWMLPGQATATPLLQALSRGRRDFLVHGEHVLSFLN